MHFPGEIPEKTVCLGFTFTLSEKLFPGLQLLGIAAEFVQSFDLALQSAPLLQSRSARRWVVPKIRILY